jgi:hypothetical protein
MMDQQPWVSSKQTTLDARRLMLEILTMCEADLHQATDIGKRALECRTFEALERHLVEIYALALEAGHPFLPDVVDQLLSWIEKTTATPITARS